jgi:hypothetical protein
MVTTIYIPRYAKEQLEASDNASKWARPIPYKDEPNAYFNYKTELNEDTLDIPDVVENDYYYPDRDQDLEATLECISQVPESAYALPETEITLGTDEKESVLEYVPTEKIDEYNESEKEEQNIEEEYKTFSKKSLETIIGKYKPKIKVSGKTMLYTCRNGYEAFFDQDGENITHTFDNDATFRDEYQSCLLEAFGVNVEYFNLPKKLDKIASSVEENEADIEGESDPASAVVNTIIEPYLKRVIQKKE